MSGRRWIGSKLHAIAGGVLFRRAVANAFKRKRSTMAPVYKSNFKTKRFAVKPEIKVSPQYSLTNKLLKIDNNNVSTNILDCASIPQSGGSSFPITTPRTSRIGAQVQLRSLRISFKMATAANSGASTDLAVRVIVFRLKAGAVAVFPVEDYLLNSTGGNASVTTLNAQPLADYCIEYVKQADAPDGNIIIHYDKWFNMNSYGDGNTRIVDIKVPKVAGLIQRYVQNPSGNAFDITQNQFWYAILPVSSSNNGTGTLGDQVAVTARLHTYKFYDS